MRAFVFCAGLSRRRRWPAIVGTRGFARGRLAHGRGVLCWQEVAVAAEGLADFVAGALARSRLASLLQGLGRFRIRLQERREPRTRMRNYG
ncbi:hypothetical protein, partial [Lysobacter enzymogenes]|uniref:hypothetical protein n=1 Tax=Lysobacter enzymogenes TaxID=69 RepID=UPI0019D182A8